MLVDVVCLRCRGARLLRTLVIAERPVRGELQVSGPRLGRREPGRAFLLVPGSPEFAQVLPALDNARVTRVSGDALLVIGVERIERHGGRSWDDYPQVWWCRLAGRRPSKLDTEPPDFEVAG
jgi:rubredoxin